MSPFTSEHIPEDPRTFFVEYLPTLPEAKALGSLTSLGSVTFRVLGAGDWSLRFCNGVLETEPGQAADVIVQATLEQEDFVPLIVDGLRRAPARANRHTNPGAFKLLASDTAVIDALRNLPGSVAFEVQTAGRLRRILITPGDRSADLERSDCAISCSEEDHEAIQEGREQPLQLFLSGRLRVSGDVQLAIALSGVFA